MGVTVAAGAMLGADDEAAVEEEEGSADAVPAGAAVAAGGVVADPAPAASTGCQVSVTRPGRGSFSSELTAR